VSATIMLSRFAGEPLAPVRRGYDEARSHYNGAVDQRAPLIARCASAEDERLALAHARDRGHK
jgi:hypothetical protein